MINLYLSQIAFAQCLLNNPKLDLNTYKIALYVLYFNLIGLSINLNYADISYSHFINYTLSSYVIFNYCNSSRLRHYSS